MRSSVNHLIAEPGPTLQARSLKSRLVDLEGRLQDLSVIVDGLRQPTSPQLAGRLDQNWAQSAAGH